jgi:hypothetical protein
MYRSQFLQGGVSEADTCRKYVMPTLIESGWDDEPPSIAEQQLVNDISQKPQRMVEIMGEIWEVLTERG